VHRPRNAGAVAGRTAADVISHVEQADRFFLVRRQVERFFDFRQLARELDAMLDEISCQFVGASLRECGLVVASIILRDNTAEQNW
jgi:hypothetical protein